MALEVAHAHEKNYCDHHRGLKFLLAIEIIGLLTHTSQWCLHESLLSFWQQVSKLHFKNYNYPPSFPLCIPITLIFTPFILFGEVIVWTIRGNSDIRVWCETSSCEDRGAAGQLLKQPRSVFDCWRMQEVGSSILYTAKKCRFQLWGCKFGRRVKVEGPKWRHVRWSATSRASSQL